MRNERNIVSLKLLSFDIKALALLNLVPPAIMAVMFIYCKDLIGTNPVYKEMIPAMEYVIPPFAAWWSIFLFQDILEGQGCEIFFTYSVSRFKLGVFRALCAFVSYCIMVGIMLYSLQTYTLTPFFSKLYFQLVAQNFFFAALGFAAMVFLSNSTYALFVVISYSSLFIFFKALNIKLIKIFIFNENLLPMKLVAERLAWPLAIAFLLWIAGQWRFIYYKDYK